MNTVTCNSCGAEVNIDDALAHQLKEQTERIKKAATDDARKQVLVEFEQKEKEQKIALEEERKKLIEDFERKKKQDEERIKEEAAKEASEKYRLEKLGWE